MTSGVSQIITLDSWKFRVRVPNKSGPFPVMLLLHGWTGNEDSMWVFASRFPSDCLLIAPRAPYQAPSGGYSWHPPIQKAWPNVEDFYPASEELFSLMNAVNFPDGDFTQINLAGFSQGAALAYTMLLTHPQRVRALAALSGFLPEGAEALVAGDLLRGKAVFITHGTRDDLVPVIRARQAAAFLEQAGAAVTYCEDDVGHKLSAACFRGMQAFYNDHRC